MRNNLIFYSISTSIAFRDEFAHRVITFTRKLSFSTPPPANNKNASGSTVRLDKQRRRLSIRAQGGFHLWKPGRGKGPKDIRDNTGCAGDQAGFSRKEGFL
jgi:hypothetical protein